MVKLLSIVWMTKPKVKSNICDTRRMPNRDLCKITFMNYQNVETRLKTFKDVKQFSSFNIEEMANAGFFHTGHDDHTICYYCGGGLKDWIEGEDPWEEHAMWFSRCGYLLIKKGRDYVDEVCGRKKKSDAPRESLENKKEEDEEVPVPLQCIVCLSKIRSVAFLPCSHCCVCTDCCSKVSSCVYCRRKIEMLVKVYLP